MTKKGSIKSVDLKLEALRETLATAAGESIAVYQGWMLQCAHAALESTDA